MEFGRTLPVGTLIQFDRSSYSHAKIPGLDWDSPETKEGTFKLTAKVEELNPDELWVIYCECGRIRKATPEDIKSNANAT